MGRRRASKPKRQRPGWSYLGLDLRAEIMHALIIESEHLEDIGTTFVVRRILRNWFDALPSEHRQQARARAGLAGETPDQARTAKEAPQEVPDPSVPFKG